jgi:CHAT domain-containing protein
MLKGMVLDPVARGLDRRRLVIVADGALQLIPFTVFPDPKDASANLISNYEIVTLPSASVLALQRRELANRKEAPLSLAVVADPVFDVDDDRMVRVLSKTKGLKTKDQPQTTAGHAASSDTKVDLALLNALRDVSLDPNALPRLYKSRDEAAEISTVVSSKESFTAIGFYASRNLVMSGKLDQYRNVHFATHGLMDLEHPELSGIVLSRFDEKGQPQDGYLRLYEIYNLNLPAELVVLSACQTGSGKQIRGEGLMALTRGFMYAGAARVVATLWKVDDAATAELMGLFYKEMFTNGKRPAAALRDAQIGLSKQRRWSSPYYWAGFVLQGEWR